MSGISSLIAGTGEERTCEAEYNTIGKVKKLTLKNSNTTLKTATFTYAADGQRRKMVVGNATTVYCDDYQVNTTGSTEQRLHYISGPAGLCALIVQSYNGSTLSSRAIYYLQTDYQGSIIAAYNSNGTLYKRFAYDPWGRRRAGDNWTNYQTSTETLITRGYCGHEHLDDFGTINMNGRIYDPRLGRFLSPDPYVQAPYNSQNYNRYSYCWNNPLKYTDPDGEWFHIVVGAIIGSVIGTLTANIKSIKNEDNFWKFMWKGAVSGVVGGAVGAATAATGGVAAAHFGATGFAAGAITGAATGAIGGALGGASNAWLNGANFRDGMLAGLQGLWIGAVSGAALGGISGGISSIRHGGNFWSGKGARFDNVAIGDISDITVGDGMEYSDEYAQAFSDEYFGTDIKGVDNLYANGSVPEGYKNVNGIVYNKEGAKVLGSTVYNGIGKGSDVYLYKAAFSCKEQLYLTMGHEYMHAAYFSVGLAYEGKACHSAIYEWEYKQSKVWHYNVAKYYYRYKNNLKYYDSTLKHSYFGFPILKNKPW